MHTDNKHLRGEFKMALPIVLGYLINKEKEWCALYARSEPNFYKQLAAQQTLRLKLDALREGKLIVPDKDMNAGAKG